MSKKKKSFRGRQSTDKPRNHMSSGARYQKYIQHDQYFNGNGFQRPNKSDTPEEIVSRYLRDKNGDKWYNRFIPLLEVPLSIIVLTLLTMGIIIVGILTVGISAVLFVSSLSMMGAAITIDEVIHTWRRLWKK